MDNQLLRYSARDHFFRAALCHLCVDSQNATNALQKYEEMFPVFGDSREAKFIRVSAVCDGSLSSRNLWWLLGSSSFVNRVKQVLTKYAS